MIDNVWHPFLVRPGDVDPYKSHPLIKDGLVRFYFFFDQYVDLPDNDKLLEACKELYDDFMSILKEELQAEINKEVINSILKQ